MGHCLSVCQLRPHLIMFKLTLAVVLELLLISTTLTTRTHAASSEMNAQNTTTHMLTTTHPLTHTTMLLLTTYLLITHQFTTYQLTTYLPTHIMKSLLTIESETQSLSSLPTT